MERLADELTDFVGVLVESKKRILQLETEMGQMKETFQHEESANTALIDRIYQLALRNVQRSRDLFVLLDEEVQRSTGSSKAYRSCEEALEHCKMCHCYSDEWLLSYTRAVRMAEQLRMSGASGGCDGAVDGLEFQISREMKRFENEAKSASIRGSIPGQPLSPHAVSSPIHVRTGGGYVSLDEMIAEKEKAYLRTRGRASSP
ncbi:hypothetical protein FOL47_002874 [Perkinsus chesapeaki]|uniref:Uncharacterized protein n=1 Tax=Perkinsus chesapeaki TaxID=330153 RepID=A0A7J6MB52_PERCH|nr:hypothetical protein FOL47_002874 [Perkinsus chesapeaki]